jgi:hypothetical protein
MHDYLLLMQLTIIKHINTVVSAIQVYEEKFFRTCLSAILFIAKKEALEKNCIVGKHLWQ